MAVRVAPELDGDVIGLLLHAWKGEERECRARVQLLAETIKANDPSPEHAMRLLFDVTDRCYQLALDPPPTVADGSEEYLMLAARMMGVPFLRRALRSWTRAESAVRFGNDLSHEVMLAVVELASRRAGSPADRGGAMGAIAPAAAKAVAGDGMLPVGPVEPAMVAPTAARARIPSDEEILVKAWPSLVSKVKATRARHPAFYLETAKGLAVCDEEVVLYLGSGRTAQLLEAWEGWERTARWIGAHLKRDVTLVATHDASGAVEMTPLGSKASPKP